MICGVYCEQHFLKYFAKKLLWGKRFLLLLFAELNIRVIKNNKIKILFSLIFYVWENYIFTKGGKSYKIFKENNNSTEQNFSHLPIKFALAYIFVSKYLIILKRKYQEMKCICLILKKIFLFACYKLDEGSICSLPVSPIQPLPTFTLSPPSVKSNLPATDPAVCHKLNKNKIPKNISLQRPTKKNLQIKVF